MHALKDKQYTLVLQSTLARDLLGVKELDEASRVLALAWNRFARAYPLFADYIVAFRSVVSLLLTPLTLWLCAG